MNFIEALQASVQRCFAGSLSHVLFGNYWIELTKLSANHLNDRYAIWSKRYISSFFLSRSSSDSLILYAP